MSTRVEELLAAAEAALHEGIEKDLLHVHDIVVNEEKYARVRELFAAVLALDPGNARAQAGIDACDAMLEPFIPVQVLAMPVIGELPDLAMPLTGGLRPTPEPEPELPWEVRRGMRSHQRRAIRHTGEVFMGAKETAAREVGELLAAARGSADPPLVVLERTLGEITALQERLNHSWKGHGPEIQRDAIARLLAGLGLDGDAPEVRAIVERAARDV